VPGLCRLSKSRKVAVVSCWCFLAVIAIACGPTTAEKRAQAAEKRAQFTDQCKPIAPTEEQGWFDTKLSSVEIKTIPPDPRLTGSEATLIAVATIRGRGVDGAFKSAQITCSESGVFRPVDGGEPQPRVISSIGQVVTEPISDADREWLHRQILQEALAAAGAQGYDEAVLLLKGKGRYKADTSQWLKTDASYKTLLTRALREEAKQKRAAVARLKAEARERRQTAAAVEMRYTAKASFGCTSQSEYMRLVEIAARGDTDGLATALTLAALADDCTTFHGGEAVYVVDSAGGTELVQIRFKGRGPHRWWISDTFLR